MLESLICNVFLGFETLNSINFFGEKGFSPETDVSFLKKAPYKVSFDSAKETGEPIGELLNLMVMLSELFIMGLILAVLDTNLLLRSNFFKGTRFLL